ncbi:MAG: lysylphosphatidylglycerol synthase transmembrane domain-containing protein [Desulfobulbus sp.]
MKPIRRHSKLALKLTVSILLLLFLYRNTPLHQIGEVLAQCDFMFLGLVVGIILVNFVLSSLKWRILLLSDQIDIPLSKLLVSYLIGSFFNLFLPSNIGGDSYRIYDIMRKSGQGVRTAASVVADRLSGFIALTCLSGVASFFVAIRVDKPLLVLLPFTLLGGLLFVLYLLWQRTLLMWLLRFFRLDRFPKLVRFCETFIAAFARYGSEPGTLVRVMLISFAFQFLLILAVYLMALAIHASAPFIFFLAFVPLITLMEAVPVSIYGIGVRDVGYVFFFQFAGIGEVHTRALAIVYVAVTLGCALIGGALFAGRVFTTNKNSALKNS